MLDVITANEIVNALQCKGHNIEWAKDHYLKYFITMDSYSNNIYDLSTGNVIQTNSFNFNRSFKTMGNLIFLWKYNGPKLEIMDFIKEMMIHMYI